MKRCDFKYCPDCGEQLESLSPSGAAPCSPVAWLHVLDTTEGIPENEPWKILSFDEKHPFGEPGKDYSEEYGPPVSTPLYFRENASVMARPDGGPNT